MPASTRCHHHLSSPKASKLFSCAPAPPAVLQEKNDSLSRDAAASPTRINRLFNLLPSTQNKTVQEGENAENSQQVKKTRQPLQGSHASVHLQSQASATRSGRRRKVEEVATCSNYEMISGKMTSAGRDRRWSSDDSVSTHLTGSEEPLAFSLTNSIHSPDSGQTEHYEQASKNVAIRVPASEAAHQECSTDTPKCWNRGNDSPNLQTHHVDTHDHHLQTVSNVDSGSPPTSASSNGGYESEHQTDKCKLQASPLPAGEGLYGFGASCCLNSTPEQSTSAAGDDENPSLMPENEEAAISPSPEKSGNWRLNAVLEAFGNLSPTREGRVKTLVRAFESLLSVTERNGEQQARKRPRGYPLKFSYLSSNAELGGEAENAQREDFTNGGEGESEKEEVADEEERVGQWQSQGDVKDAKIDDRWQSPVTAQVSSQSVVEGKATDGMSKPWLQEQECAESREQGLSTEREDGMEKVLQKQEAQDGNAQLNVDTEDKGGMGEQWQLPVVASDEKQYSIHEGVNDEEVGDMEKLSQAYDEILACSVVNDEEDKNKKPDEEQAEGVNALTLQKGDETKQQPSDIVSPQSLKKVLIENEAEKDGASQELKMKHVPMEAAVERQPPNEKNRTKLQQHSFQKSIDGHFTRKQQSSRIRESLRGSNCSISSTRPPLTQRCQMQSAQDKPCLSKPQPFKLLTEARGHVKEQEFMLRLTKLLEEEEKLRVPLAQGLPWTTDEPEIPYKPPAKENTKPLDVQLNSYFRAMERAEFDRFIAEKLLYIEGRRLEEESRRRAAEEEEIKKMRQDMVPKAQLMPYFDRPFRPTRSSKRPTIPKEPQFHLNKQQPKRQKCVANST